MKRWQVAGWRVDLWLVAILAIAAALRFVEITQPLVDAFSWRQASTAMMADNFYSRSWNIFYPEVSWTGPGPSYQGREFQIVSYITALLYTFFGWHDWIGRVVAACFGVGSVCSLYLLANAVWGRTHAKAVGLAMAILPGAVFIDRSFLPDPAMLALTTTALFVFVKYIDNERRSYLLAACLLLTLGVLAKLPGIAVGVPFAYLALEATFATRRHSMRWLLVVTFCGLVSVCLILGYYSWAVYLGNAYPPYHVAGSGYIWQDGFSTYIRERFFLEKAAALLYLWYLLPVFMVIAGIGLLWGAPKQPAEDRGRWVFHAWMLGAVLVYLAGAREITSNPWNMLIGLAPIAAFIGRGFCVIVGANGSSELSLAATARLAVVAVVALLTGTVPAHQLLSRPIADNAHVLGQELNRLSMPGDLVVTVASDVGDPVAIYYSRRRGWVFPPGGGEEDWSIFEDDAKAIETLEQLRSEGADWFGFTTDATDNQDRKFTEHHKQLLDHLERISVDRVSTDDYVIYQLSEPPAS